MKEQGIKNQGQLYLNYNFGDDKSRLKRKFSMDLEQNVSSTPSNFNVFSHIADQFFLNSPLSSLTFEFLHLQAENTSDINNSHQISPKLETLYSCSSPQTPSSFGFKECPFRMANVSISDGNVEKSYQNVQVYLVNDNQDNSKAGLLFKYEKNEIDLRIYKNQGEILESTGKLQGIKCELWKDDSFKWTQIQATITLII